ncbi:aminoimidazole riboside kinase [Tepidibacillus sp. HK-1]|uniref:aminoimidazole riboside kinase n=1 Tax=Tepidibacillus sp. HK-1 TaxID=1883407 RepID=UPI0008539886|nr:aminoimidazole riboside kinase [Tepidibacillus sp. HK-1]GBF11490.1 5-dehydro-2-deoxygluconokinase [Tepidibacillus sp. HK-1]
MKKGVISLGEALIDFIPVDQTNTTYQKNPGGAPANVAVGLSRLGVKSVFLGKVGNDALGKFLKETLHYYGVDVSSMYLTDEAHTGLVLVTLAENGERSFEFYIKPSADLFLKDSEISEEIFEKSKIFHFGSITLTREPAKSATIKAIQLAKEKGLIVSFDPNLRLGLWQSKEQAREEIISMLPAVDLLKISEEELEFITGENEINTGIQQLKKYRIPLVFITLGEKGSYTVVNDNIIHVPAMKVNAVDTTGAGDAFVSAILYWLNEYEGELMKITAEDAEKMARFASVSGGLAASIKGAMTALPTLKQVQKILGNQHE